MTENRKIQLFFIIGPSRIGKSIAVDKIREQHNPIILHTDAVRAGARMALLGLYPKRINSVTIDIKTNLYPQGEEKLSTRSNVGEDSYAWDAVIGMIAYYRGSKFDVLVEGVAAQLERVITLKGQLPEFNVRTAIIGFNDESVADEIIKYSNENHDHLWYEMQQSGKGEGYVREMVRDRIPINKALEAQARKQGESFRYFDRSLQSFDAHTKAIADFYKAN